MEMLQGVWKQYLRPRAVVGYGVKIFLPSPPNYVTRSPGKRGVNDLLISFLGLLHLRNFPFRWKSPGNEVAIHYPGTLLCPVVDASTKSSLACYLKITAVFLVIHTIVTVK